eukprot:Hpha_TRINITY_DN16122_c1_g2::TRINITY_DN16122_c1_g2_i1::g.7255::m.7255
MCPALHSPLPRPFRKGSFFVFPTLSPSPPTPSQNGWGLRGTGIARARNKRAWEGTSFERKHIPVLCLPAKRSPLSNISLHLFFLTSRGYFLFIIFFDTQLRKQDQEERKRKHRREEVTQG